MLFKRYSDVSFLLRSMKYEELSSFIFVMLEERRDEQLIEAYRLNQSNPFNEQKMSFEEFKNEVTKQSNDSLKTKEQKELEALAGMNKALEMLGGDIIGG